MTLTEKHEKIVESAKNKSCVYRGKKYIFGENYFVDQFLLSATATELFPDDFGPFDLSEISDTKEEPAPAATGTSSGNG